MSAKVLTKAAAKEAKIELVERRTGVAACMMWWSRCGRRGVPVRRTRNESDVNLSGAKPWRQKGTGRGARAINHRQSGAARRGLRAKPRDYSKKVSKSVRRLAFQKVLSERNRCGDVLTIGEFRGQRGKNQSLRAVVKKQMMRAHLIVSDQFDENTYKSARNVKPVKLATASDVNTEQLLAFEKI